MSTTTKPLVTPTEYLSRERAAETKSEYLNGEILPMVGASREHNVIAGNIYALLWNQLRNRDDCEVYGSDMRVKVSPTGLYAYPDVVAVCGEPQFEDDEFDTLLNPTVIVEVLSESTEAYDRGEKFAHYRRLESLSDYLLVAQDRSRVEHFTRNADDQWLLSDAAGPEQIIAVASLGCTLRLSEVYHKVNLPAS